MNLMHALILGIVEGVTEFLPISSTFHLIFSSKVLGLPSTDFTKLFEIFIQGGAILSVVFLYIKEVWKDKELIKKAVISFVPTAMIGLLLYKAIKNIFFESSLLMLSVFVLMGLLFLLVEYLVKGKKLDLKKSLKSMTYREAIGIGLIQALAVVPGVSRAGAVIVGMMFFSYKRDEAAKYSFILAVPTILAASGYDLFKMRSVVQHNLNNALLLAAGSVVAFISSYIVIRWFIGFLKHNSLAVFGYYRFILAIILVVFRV